jgi:hypothetical protein
LETNVMTNKQPVLLLAGITLVLLLAGCGSREPPTGVVSGTVSFKGKPLPEGVVTFINEEEGRIANGAIKDGQYEVPNAPVGPCGIEVTVNTGQTPASFNAASRGRREMAMKRARENGQDVSDSAPTAPQEKRNVVSIPGRYGRAKTSGLKLTVAEGQQTYDIELKP